MGILTIFGWPGTARLVRGQILSLREQEFMVAAEATGLTAKRKIFKHLVPNVMPQLIVSATLGLGGIILYESTLSYLNLGVPFPYAAWGSMIGLASPSSEGKRNFTFIPYLWVPAGILIVMAVLSFNFVGDGLRDAFDPKAKR
jgi:peptide/nickel transport system permease protein